MQLSEDGKSWVPINLESRNLPLDQSNVTVVKNQQFDNNQMTIITIFYLVSTVVVLIPGFWIVVNVVYFLFWCLTLQWWSGDPFTPVTLFEIFSIFV